MPTSPDGAKGNCPDVVAYLPKTSSDGDADHDDEVIDRVSGEYGTHEEEL